MRDTYHARSDKDLETGHPERGPIRAMNAGPARVVRAGFRRPRGARLGTLTAIAVTALVAAGCGSSPSSDQASASKPLMLAGPNTNIMIAIPDGWHQVIDSTNPAIPEMVAPTTCLGSGEVSCATGLARIATLTAPSAQAAEATVEHVVTATPGVKVGQSLSQGPGKVGHHDGYLHRFTYSNPSANLTCEIAAVPTGPSKPDAQGNREFSVVLAWVSDKLTAPKPAAIDQIVGSAVTAGGQPTG
jgi:hypothetical protein